MKLLAFDTTLSACSVAILNQDQYTVLYQIAPKQHAQLILHMMQEALHQANLELTDLDAIAYGCGPGSFTGIRIASSVAQGLAYPAHLPVVQISSLAAMAQSAHEVTPGERFLVAVDGRMNQVYVGEYVSQQSGLVELVGEELAVPPDEFHCNNSLNSHALGDGWSNYPQLLSKLSPQPISVNPEQTINAKAVLDLAKKKLVEVGGVHAHEALPVYLR